MKLKLLLLSLWCCFASNLYAQEMVADVTRSGFQDLKNFLALQSLKKDTTLPPLANLSAGAALQAQQLWEADYFLPQVQKWQNFWTAWNNYLKQEELLADKNIVAEHHRYSCQPEEKRLGFCTNLANVNDLSSTSLYGAKILKPDTAANAAALRYVRNVVNPKPLPLLHTAQMFKDQARGVLTQQGQEYLASKYQQQALFSMVQQSFAHSLQERQARELQAQESQSYTSQLKLLEQEATRRFQNPDWHLELDSKPLEAVLKEIGHMYAVDLALKMRDSQRLERMEGLLATQLALLTQALGAGQAAQTQAQGLLQVERY